MPCAKTGGDRVQAVIGFHAARAARIAAVEWVGNTEDIARLPISAEVEVSLEGPGGPWLPAGPLPAPDAKPLQRQTDA